MKRPGSASRILVLEPQSQGGLWHYACALSRALTENGLEVILGTIAPVEPLEDSESIRLFHIDTRASGTLGAPAFLYQRIIRQWNRVRGLRQIMREFRPDIVHLHSPLGGLDFLYFNYVRSLGARVVYTAHDSTPLDRQPGWIDWARYREADAILVHTSSGVKELIARGIDGSKIAKIPLGNYLQFCKAANMSKAQAKPLLGLPADSRVVLFFGGIAPYKGLDNLIDAFAKLSIANPPTYLVIAGRTTDFAPYQRQIERLDLTERVILDLKYVPFSDFPKFFVSADLVALPYRRISQSGVLQLAYGFGRPVVVTNVGGLGEAVAEDGTGAVAEASDSETLASAMQRLLSDPVGAAVMGQRGRHLAETKYSWDSIAQRVAQVYDIVVSGWRGQVEPRDFDSHTFVR